MRRRGRPGRARALGLVLALLAGCATLERPPSGGPDVIYIPTPEAVGREMLRVTGVGRDDVVFDLGSGDGRLVIAAARDFGARGVGVEIEGALVRESRERALQAGVAERVTFLWQDLFQTDLASATVVTLYLRDDVNLRLRPKLLRELRPGTRVASHDFGMGEWVPDRTLRLLGPEREHVVYTWIVPAPVAGRWQWAGEAGPVTLHLEQRFQEVAGRLEEGGRAWPVFARLEGDRLRVVVERAAGGASRTLRLEGRAEGDLLTGTATEGEGTAARPWLARRERAP